MVRALFAIAAQKFFDYVCSESPRDRKVPALPGFVCWTLALDFVHGFLVC